MSSTVELCTANWTLVSWAALYLLYAQLEEEWGLARHAMAVYDRATRAVEPAQQYDMFNIYIKRAAEIYGVTHTRGIYQKAIEVPTTSDLVWGWGPCRQEDPRKPACMGWVAEGCPEARYWDPFPLTLLPLPRGARCCLMSMPVRCA